ncbi:hypothetical protein C8R44DRAFT_734384 [Mycena epipterygia]|nr:hypothetical protein C8R44DRAFT_734384 [Mycena epipterygia]
MIPSTHTVIYSGMAPPASVSLHSLEDEDMAECFEIHKAEEEQLSLWPLDDEPLLWFPLKDAKTVPDWDNDPPTFSLLWGKKSTFPIRLPGPHIQTNLFGRTAAEAFADFPTDFYDSPSPPSSPSLSPVSPAFPPSSLDEHSGQLPTNDLPDPSIDEVSQQLSDSVHLNSPPQSPRPLSIPEPLHIDHDDIVPIPPSPSTCDPLSINSLSDAFSSSSSTLSVGTSSTASSTYAVSPSPKPSSTISSRNSPAPGLRRSPRRSSPPVISEVSELSEQYRGSPVATWDSHAVVPTLNQIILEEYPLDTARRRRNAKRTGFEDEELTDDEDVRPRKRTVKTAPKRHPCTVPGCTESFTRLNDVLRHIKNAAIHKGTTQQAEALASSPTVCKKCGEELSRPDAARRHELKASCGKRTIRRKSTYSMLPA